MKDGEPVPKDIGNLAKHWKKWGMNAIFAPMLVAYFEHQTKQKAQSSAMLPQTAKHQAHPKPVAPPSVPQYDAASSHQRPTIATVRTGTVVAGSNWIEVDMPAAGAPKVLSPGLGVSNRGSAAFAHIEPKASPAHTRPISGPPGLTPMIQEVPQVGGPGTTAASPPPPKQLTNILPPPPPKPRLRSREANIHSKVPPHLACFS